jgi:hypothetical protein
LIIFKEFILFPELIFLIQDNFIDFINFLFPDIGHTGIKLIPGSFKLIKFFLELFVGLNDIVDFFEGLFVFGFEVDCCATL